MQTGAKNDRHSLADYTTTREIGGTRVPMPSRITEEREKRISTKGERKVPRGPEGRKRCQRHALVSVTKSRRSSKLVDRCDAGRGG